MDINLLVLNIGNSRLGIGAFVGGELKHVCRIPHEQRSNWPGKLAETWSHIAGRENGAVAGASVNPGIATEIEPLIQQATGQKIAWVGKDLDLPIKVLTDQPQETGVDRILNIAAAYEQMQKACVVVDAGTAITVDCCNDKGEYLGGAIAPGVAIMLQSVHAHTARLPLVELTSPPPALARNTADAIRSGVYHGVRGMVKELVEAYATELGLWPDIIATGGDAKMLFEGWELVHAVAPDLTFYGIALAYAEHHIKHKT